MLACALLPADAVVLAIGDRLRPTPSADYGMVRGIATLPTLFAFASAAVRPDEPVIILGSGLTAVHAVLSLTEEPRNAPITLISAAGTHSAIPPGSARLADRSRNNRVQDLLAAPGGIRTKALFLRCEDRREKSPRQEVTGEVSSTGMRPHAARLAGDANRGT